MIRIIHAYPDLLNLYGDYANIMLLAKRLSCAGKEITVDRFEIGDDVEIDSADFIYFGCATENKMLAALKDLSRIKNQLAEYVKKGGKMFFCGASAALPLDTVTDLQGNTVDGLGLVKGNAVIHGKRNYSEVTAKCSLCDATVIGFFNSSMNLTAEATPFWQIQTDSVGLVGKSEGYISNGIMATQLSGPLFFRNPPLLNAICEMLTGEKLNECDEKLFAELDLGYTHLLDEISK